MIALTRTHSKTALLCFAFLLTGAGCEQKVEAPQTSDDMATTEAVHEEHAHDEHEHDHEGHEHEGHDPDHEHEHGADHAGHDHEGHHHDAADMTTYNCQPEQTIKAHYDPEGSTQPATSAHLIIDDVEYDLTAMTLPQNNSAGAAYETDIGIANDAGMTWELNADTTKAILRNKTLDGSVIASDEDVLFDCQKTNG